MSDHWLNQFGPIVTFVLIVAAFIRRGRRAGASPRERKPARNSIVPTRLAAAAAAPPPTPARAVRRRPAEPAVPAPLQVRPRPSAAASMTDMLPAEAAAAFPLLDLSLGDAEPGGSPGAGRPRARRARAGARIGSRGWGINAIVAAEVLGTPVGLRPGATVGVPHAF